MDNRRCETVDAGELISTYRVIANSAPFVCGDCGNATDLGFKCRACYAAWSRSLWADVPREHRRLLALSRALHKHPGRREIARHLLDGTGDALTGEERDLLALARECLIGPFKENVEAFMKGLVSAAARDSEPATAKPQRELLR
jgi:hypothetical protein